jgi:uncharacterized repeat protein (TIGR02543 family)
MSRIPSARRVSGVSRLAAAIAASALVAASVLVATPAHAATFTDGDYEFESLTATTARITDYTGGPVAGIPSTLSDGTSTYTVTEIDSSAFDSKGLTSVTIPDTVEYIGSSAFGSNSLTSLVIPDSVTSMGSYAFQWNLLTHVTLGSGLSSIPNGTFFASPLASLDIPDTITNIGDEAFVNTALTSLTIPDSVISIGASAFSVTGLLTSIHLGSSLESIGPYAFASTGLTNVTIPASVTEIGNRAFDTNGSGMATVVFQGEAPSTFTARSSGNGSFGDVDALMYYSSAHAADFTPSPWNGYQTSLGATLFFDRGGHGPHITPVVLISGEVPSAPTDPRASGYRFDGWFTTATGGTAYDFSSPLTGDATAYARWTATDLAATGAEPEPGFALGGALALLGLLALLLAAARRRSRAFGR